MNAFVPAIGVRTKVRRPKRVSQGRCDCGVYRFPHRPGSCARKADQSIREMAEYEAQHSPDDDTKERAAIYLDSVDAVHHSGDASFDFGALATDEPSSESEQWSIMPITEPLRSVKEAKPPTRKRAPKKPERAPESPVHHASECISDEVPLPATDAPRNDVDAPSATPPKPPATEAAPTRSPWHARVPWRDVAIVAGAVAAGALLLATGRKIDLSATVSRGTLRGLVRLTV